MQILPLIYAHTVHCQIISDTLKSTYLLQVRGRWNNKISADSVQKCRLGVLFLFFYFCTFFSKPKLLLLLHGVFIFLFGWQQKWWQTEATPDRQTAKREEASAWLLQNWFFGRLADSHFRFHFHFYFHFYCSTLSVDCRRDSAQCCCCYYAFSSVWFNSEFSVSLMIWQCTVCVFVFLFSN